MYNIHSNAPKFDYVETIICFQRGNSFIIVIIAFSVDPIIAGHCLGTSRRSYSRTCSSSRSAASADAVCTSADVLSELHCEMG
jgi:hypothetical protein